jgi:SAM-dependent methyltransferase
MDLVEAASTIGNRHPWELSRRDSVLQLLSDRGPWRDVADVGAGDRFFAASLRELASGAIYAVDVHYQETAMVDGIQIARDVADLPDAGLDCVVMMDVLEHVEDEAAFLRQVRRKLRLDGTVLVTVPAFQHLFRAHDIYLKHFRRYRREHLRDVLESHGLRVEESFYFYATLFVARSLEVAVSRVVGEIEQWGVGRWRFGLRHPLTVLVRAVLDLDYRVCRALTRLGLAVPGLSLCAVCKNTSA